MSGAEGTGHPVVKLVGSLMTIDHDVASLDAQEKIGTGERPQEHHFRYDMSDPIGAGKFGEVKTGGERRARVEGRGKEEAYQ